MRERLRAITAAAAIAAAALVIRAASAQPPAWSARSGSERVQVVELYSSQGCSSCPPAEAWLGRFLERDELWRERIPINFRVDYWDGLGWPDRYASRGQTRRQYAYVRELGLRSAATPAFIIDGKEWRGYFRRESLPEPAASAPGRLEAELREGSVQLRFTPSAEGDSLLEAHVAILGVGLIDAISRGENRGRTLRQDFVVLGHAAQRIEPEAGVYRTDVDLPSTVSAKPEKWAIVVWMARPEDPEPLQATGGWVPAELVRN